MRFPKRKLPPLTPFREGKSFTFALLQDTVVNGAVSLSHRGKRSPRSLVKRYCFSHAFRDDELQETVYIGDSSNCLRFILEQTYGNIQQSWLSFERGEVLTNSRGTGSVQCCVGAFQI